MESYYRVKAKGGAPGMDGNDFKDIEKTGAIPFLKNIQQELIDKTYRAQPAKRIWIEKANGKLRPIAIPSIKDRVVQMSCKMVIEPIFEADFADSSYGFRPKRNAGQAVSKIREHLSHGRTHVFDADLSSFFDTIPHDKLMIVLRKRIGDKNILWLINMWLKAPVWEAGKISGGKKKREGVQQGGVISPLLSNVYLNLLDQIVNKPKGSFDKASVKIVRYADDFLLMSNFPYEKQLEQLEGILERMGVKINQEKSKLVNAREKAFDFLGFMFRFDRSPYKGCKNRYWYIAPSEQSEKKFRAMMKEYICKRIHFHPEAYVKDLNSKLKGWINYFRIDGVSYMSRSISKSAGYLGYRIQKSAKRQSQRTKKRYSHSAYLEFVTHHGLLNMYKYATCTRPMRTQRKNLYRKAV